MRSSLLISLRRIEKDCTVWAHERLRALLAGTSSSEALVKSVSKVEGEVSVNVRKGRIRQVFDLTIELVLEAKDTADTLGATITDYMSDTTWAGFEFNTTDQLPNLKRAIWEALETFKREVEEVQGRPLLIAGRATADNEMLQQPQPSEKKFDSTGGDVGISRPQNSSSSTTGLDDTITINAPRVEVYACLTDPQRIGAWTRGTSQLPPSLKVGSSFKLLQGAILGTVTDLSVPERICMDWRLKHWDADCVSNVQISLLEGGPHQTLIKLKQTGIPRAESEAIRENWHRYYWEPIKALLGCSSLVF